jgi:uncharacterized protein YecE (DUF72 family)
MENVSRHVYVVFNNHYRGFATQNAEKTQEVLGLKRRRWVQESGE